MYVTDYDKSYCITYKPAVLSLFSSSILGVLTD